MLKRFGFKSFQKLEDDTGLPRLRFGVRFRDSAYLEGKLHPILDGLLFYLYRHGELAEYGEIRLSQLEDQKVKELLFLIRKGSLSSLDGSIFTTNIVLACIKKYLKYLPNCLLWRIKMDEWRKLSFLLPKLCDPQNQKMIKLDYCGQRIESLLLQLKTPNRNFFHVFLKTLRQVSNRSRDPGVAALRLADYFGPIIMSNRVRRSVSRDEQIDLRFSLRHLILHSARMFPNAVVEFSNELPLYNVSDGSSPEEGEEALEYAFLSSRRS